MMAQRMIGPLVLAAVMVAGAYGQQATQSDRVYQAALHKEMVERDLKGAIEEYKKVAKATDRALAAKALLRMAECYQKLGDSEATKIYEQLVRDFGGQPEAAEARARLAAVSRDSQTPSRNGWRQRPVTTTPTVVGDTGGISYDGRFLAYTTPGDEEGGLIVRDLQTGRDRRVVANAWTRSREIVDYRAVFSRDGKQLAYSWVMDGRMELRVVRLDARGMPSPRTLVNLNDVRWIRPHDWSSDGKTIAVGIIRGDMSRQVGLVSAETGALKVLQSTNWDDGNQMSFSPDGKYLAFGQFGTGRQGDILVLAVDGSQKIDAVVQPGFDSLIGWSPDGKHLVFLSDRGGQPEIWSQPFVDGRFGQATQLNPKAGGVDFTGILGLTATGALYYAVGNDVLREDIKTALIDFAAGKLLSVPALAVPENVGANSQPAWSHDGRSLAYVSASRDGTGEIGLVVRTADGDSRPRELRPKLTFTPVLPGGIQWSADDKSLIVEARDFDGRQGLYRVDVQTGDALPLMKFGKDELIARTQLSSDGSMLYFLRLINGPLRPVERVRGGDFAFFQRDIATGRETEIFRFTHYARYLPSFVVSADSKSVYFTRQADPQGVGGPPALIARDLSTRIERQLASESPGVADLSPDGRFIARQSASGALLLIPTNTAEARVLGNGLTVLCWSHDSQSIVVRDRAKEVWWVPIDGRERVKVNLNFEDAVASRFQVHPDGQRVAFTLTTGVRPTASQNRSTGIWALENFLPAAKPKK